MTTTEQIQALQNAINQLQTQVNNLSGQVSTNTNNLSLHILDCVDDINTITGRLGALTAEDVNIHQEIHNISVQTDNNTSSIGDLELADEAIYQRLDALEAGQITLQGEIDSMDDEHHRELHTLSLQVDNNTGKIADLEVVDTNLDNRITVLEAAKVSIEQDIEDMDAEHHSELHTLSLQVDNNTGKIADIEVVDTNLDNRITVLETAKVSLEQDIEDMDTEHHTEMHLLSLAIDNSLSRITNLEIFKAETPAIEVLTEEEYEALGTPDYDTFYYTYED